jgi:glycosyltransferase involved in cell wall biosynthesis
MRIALISTTEGEGGAARAARRLHRALRAAGVESSLLVGRKTSSDPGVIEVPPTGIPGAPFWPLLQQYLIDTNRAGPWNTHFSLGLPGTQLDRHPAVREADIIHLHWVAGFLSAADVARLLALGKPVVWTMHDERGFTGGCHYTFECDGFASGCQACPQLRQDPQHLPAALLADARTLWLPDALTIVTPSRWMANQVRRSALFRSARMETIAYGLETDLFRPLPRAGARATLGIAPDTLALLFGADFGVERRKGFRELVAALQLCLRDDAFRRRCDERRVTLLCFGHPGEELKSLPMTVQALGYVRDDGALARIYAASDLFLLPSLADNLPCTMLEALSCGTPVVAFATGGIPEGLEDGATGRLAPTGDVGQFARAILDLAADETTRGRMSLAARAVAESRFSLEVVAAQHLRLYEQLRTQPRKPAVSPGDALCSPQLTEQLPAFGREAVARQSERDSTNKRWRWLLRRVERLGDARGDLPAWLREFTRLTEVSNKPKRLRYWDDIVSLFHRR